MKNQLRVIVSSCGTPTKIKLIQKTLSHFPLSYCTLIYIKNKFPFIHHSNTLWLDYQELIYGRYATHLDSLIPIEDSLLRKLSYCETMVLQMMNRLDWDETITYVQRKNMYLNHVRFWNNEIITKKINLSIFLGIPHEMYDFVLYSLCKLYTIPTIILESGRHRDTTLLYHDYESSMIKLHDKYAELLKKEKTNPISLKVKITDIVSKKFARKLSDLSYLKMSTIEVYKWRIYESLSYLKQVISTLQERPFDIFSQVINPLFYIQRIRSLVKKQTLKLYYYTHSQKPDISKKYIYVALHYQPECTTSPQGGIFVNQDLMVHMLHQSLPNNVYLYVKEHPLPSYTMRSFSFYQSLLSLPRVRLIRVNENSANLIENALAIATVTGTIGWEAIEKLKPVLMFGYEYYQYAPGVFQIRNINDCARTCSVLVNNKINLSIKKLNLFYKAMEEVMIDGYIDEYYKPQSFLSQNMNIRNLSSALKKEIHQLTT